METFSPGLLENYFLTCFTNEKKNHLIHKFKKGNLEKLS